METADDLEEHEGLDELSESRMTIIEHLGELRRRVLYSVIAVAFGFAISWVWVEEIFQFLLVPLQTAAEASGSSKDLSQVNYKDIIEPFFVLIKTALASGVFLGIPVILWQVWAFVAPGLYKHEKRLAIPFVVIATLFFLGGSSFCYFFVMPQGFRFLLEFNQQISQPVIMMREHYALSVKLLLAFGLVFEMPVVAMFLSALGVITHVHLIKGWRYSVVGSFVFAAMLTPPDIVTQTAMAVPLVILYTLSIGVAYFFTKRHERRRAAEEAALKEMLED